MINYKGILEGIIDKIYDWRNLYCHELDTNNFLIHHHFNNAMTEIKLSTVSLRVFMGKKKQCSKISNVEKDRRLWVIGVL